MTTSKIPSYTDLPISTFDELRNAAAKLDKHMHQREAEKRGTSSQNTSTSSAQKDPNAMDIDTSNQNPQSSTGSTNLNRQMYLKWMTGKCIGCGSKDHAKKDGHHKRDVCNHCGKMGHRGPVCFSKYMKNFSKYMKKPGKTAGAAATTTEFMPFSSTASATTTSLAKDSKQQADLLAQLMEKVRAREQQIAALKSSF